MRTAEPTERPEPRPAEEATARTVPRLATALAGIDRRWPWIAGVAVAIWVVMVRTRVRRGISVTPDGRRYLERAEAIANGDWAFTTISARPLHFPPLYPALIALVDRLTPFGPEGAAVAINVVAAGLAVIGLDRLARRVLAAPPLPRGWRALVPVALLWTGDMVAAGGAVLSDIVFLALWAWLAVLLIDHLRDGRIAPLAAVAVLGSVAVLTRYAAGFLVVGVVAVVAVSELARRRLPWRAALVGAVALGPTVLWYSWAGDRVSTSVEDDTRHGAIGLLSPGEAFVDSVVGWGAKLIGIAQRRVGGYLGRSTFTVPWLADAMPAIAVVLAVASAVAVAVALWRTRIAWRWGFRPAPADREPAAPAIPSATSAAVWASAVPALVYLGLLYGYRAYAGFFVIQRYLALAPFVAWLAIGVLARRRDGWAPLLTAALAGATLVGCWGAFLALRL